MANRRLGQFIRYGAGEHLGRQGRGRVGQHYQPGGAERHSQVRQFRDQVQGQRDYGDGGGDVDYSKNPERRRHQRLFDREVFFLVLIALGLATVLVCG